MTARMAPLGIALVVGILLAVIGSLALASTVAPEDVTAQDSVLGIYGSREG
jgi:hypothetical protein